MLYLHPKKMNALYFSELITLKGGSSTWIDIQNTVHSRRHLV